MEQYLLLTVFGVLIGVFGTLIGAGGGFILTPILLLLYPKDSPDTITSISLAVTCANAISGSIAYGRMKRINYRYGLFFSAACIPGAVLGAISTYYVPRRTFDLVFAIILLVVSLVIFVKVPNESGASDDCLIHLSSRKLFIGILLSLGVGFVSSFLGIGGGIIHVPVLSNILLFPVHIATATSHFILAIATFVGTVVHIISGTFHHGVRRAVALAIGVLIGAQIGAMLSSKVRSKVIIRSLAVALYLVGIRLTLLYFSGQ
ncbi:MAG: sulfite exporter TauE/SafE family protein [Deltaproteobacteria bacterium]|nr:sulfite exporter TauE/SafE family protein [Deltaproteobacteria bacterium]MBF0524314.1 sulfite exporter TauE/SafE family protein [Deltaproteobacteria bacterium]